MGKIYYVMGKSCSGKDTIYRRLTERHPELRVVVPYTTRPIREGEQDGVEYFFVDREKMEEMRAAGRIIELRSYNTVLGVWNYFTADDGQIDLAAHSYLIIGTLVSYQAMRDYYGRKRKEKSLSMKKCAAGSWRMRKIFPRRNFAGRGSRSGLLIRIWNSA